MKDNLIDLCERRGPNLHWAVFGVHCANDAPIATTGAAGGCHRGPPMGQLDRKIFERICVVERYQRPGADGSFPVPLDDLAREVADARAQHPERETDAILGRLGRTRVARSCQNLASSQPLVAVDGRDARYGLVRVRLDPEARLILHARPPDTAELGFRADLPDDYTRWLHAYLTDHPGRRLLWPDWLKARWRCPEAPDTVVAIARRSLATLRERGCSFHAEVANREVPFGSRVRNIGRG